jgi:hypothetical protein
MKKSFFKAFTAATAATALLFTVATAFAADCEATTSTTYANDQMTVTSVVKAPSGQQVTYLLTQTGSVASEEDILYIDQWQAGTSAKTIEYNLKAGEKDAMLKYGSNVEATAIALNAADKYKTILHGTTTINIDAGVLSFGDIPADANSGKLIEGSLTLAPGFEIKSFTLNGEEVSRAENAFSYVSTGNDTIVITTAPTNSESKLAIVRTITNDDVQIIDTDDQVIETNVVGLVAYRSNDTSNYGIIVKKDGSVYNTSGVKNGLYAAAEGSGNYYGVIIAGVEAGEYTLMPYADGVNDFDASKTITVE